MHFFTLKLFLSFFFLSWPDVFISALDEVTVSIQYMLYMQPTTDTNSVLSLQQLTCLPEIFDGRIFWGAKIHDVGWYIMDLYIRRPMSI